jgi:hypothetical protein
MVAWHLVHLERTAARMHQDDDGEEADVEHVLQEAEDEAFPLLPRV